MVRVAIPTAIAAVLLLTSNAVASSQQNAPAAPAQEAPGQPAPTAPGADSLKSAPLTDPQKMGETAAKVPAGDDAIYVIGAEDVLGIQVWGDPRLSGSFLVRPDGRISMALIGDVTAASLTPERLETAISDTLKAKKIINHPQVMVAVTAINSKKYFLQGEVNRTGAFPLVVPTTVLEALVNAGGFKDFANQKKIEVIRGSERFQFNYKDVIHGKHREQNIKLQPGDIIIVP